MFKITGFYFAGKYVFYSTLIGKDRFMSIHDRTGLTDEQAMNLFVGKHNEEVKQLIIQKTENENNKSKAADSRIIRSA